MTDKETARLRALNAEMVALLRTCSCPRPANAAPDDLSVEECMDRAECGCDIGAIITKAGAPS